MEIIDMDEDKYLILIKINGEARSYTRVQLAEILEASDWAASMIRPLRNSRRGPAAPLGAAFDEVDQEIARIKEGSTSWVAALAATVREIKKPVSEHDQRRLVRILNAMDLPLRGKTTSRLRTTLEELGATLPEAKEAIARFLKEYEGQLR